MTNMTKVTNIAGVKNTHLIASQLNEIEGRYKRLSSIRDSINRIVDVFNKYIDEIEYETVEYEYDKNTESILILVKGFYFTNSKVSALSVLLSEYKIEVYDRKTIRIKL